MPHIHDSIVINAPADVVFALGRDPRSWTSWWVNLPRRPRIKGSGSTGSEVRYDCQLAGLELHLKTKVLADRFEADGAGHWRGTMDGSMHGEQRWDYLPSEEGAVVTADVDYEMDERVLRAADQLLVERMEEQAIHQSLENLKFVVEHLVRGCPDPLSAALNILVTELGWWPSARGRNPHDIATEPGRTKT